jgi:hypothetical protein
MYRRFVHALKVAAREEGFVQILGAGAFLVILGTLVYSSSQHWSLADGFYFSVATLTTSSIADPHLVITGAPIKIFTVFYILVGIGILVELARQIGFAYVARASRRTPHLPEPRRASRKVAGATPAVERPHL